MGPSALWSEGSGEGTVLRLGMLGGPRRPGSGPEEFPTEVEGPSSALDLDRVLLHFSNVGSMKLKTVFSNVPPPPFIFKSLGVHREKHYMCF